MILAAIVAVTFIGVVYRYALEAPLNWTDELARFLLVWFTFLGALITSFHKAHVEMTVLANKLPPLLKKVVDCLALAVMAGVMITIIWTSWPTIETAASNKTPALSLPVWLFYIALPVTFIPMLFGVVIQCIRQILGLDNASESNASSQE